MEENAVPAGFLDMLSFGLVEALLGRRSRRFFMGAEIPDGFFAYKSEHKPMPLSELEKLLVVMACGGNTGWHHLIYRAQCYAPHLSNYAGAAGGRTFPSAAGFHTSKTFSPTMMAFMCWTSAMPQRWQKGKKTVLST